MNKRVTWLMIVVLGLTTLAGALLGCAGGQAGAAFEPAAASPATTTDLNAGLLSSVLSPEVSGHAVVDVDDRGAAELAVSLRAAGPAAGQTLDVFIDGAPAGRVTLDDSGQGELRAEREAGQTVPVISAGSTIEVRQNDQVVASGQFATTSDDAADDNSGDNGDDDNANDNGSDDNANDNGSDDNANDNGGDDNANDNGGDDNANDNANDNGGDDNANDNGGDDNGGDDNGDDDNANDDDDNGNDDNDHDDNSGHGGDDNSNDNDNSGPGNGDDNANDNGNN